MNNYIEVMNTISPSIESSTLTDIVIEKTRIRRRKSLHNLCVTATIIMILTSITITAGAVSDWDYPGIARYFFGGRQNVVEGMHDEIRYQVEDMPDEMRYLFEGMPNEIHYQEENNFTIEIAGLYADNQSILLSVDVIADEPIFDNSNNWNEFLVNHGDGGHILNHIINQWEPVSVSTRTSHVSANVINAFIRIDNLSHEVIEGNVYSIMFSGIRQYVGEEEGKSVFSYPIGAKNTEIKFIIDKIAMENLVTVYPDITLENGNTITEMSINPFSITFLFDGIEEPPSDEENFWVFSEKIIDDEIVPTVTYTLTILNIVTKSGTVMELINATYTCFSNSTDTEQTTKMMFHVAIDDTLDANDIAAVVYRGIEIPIG
ncbi:MAG: hypothetical protein LBD23_18325 [Oscillospiraceae bacterium]|jgi:hypothetical protein|nr:hypothetical protein [Oscillospiraceae bacterium]